MIMTLSYVTLVYEPDFFESELCGLHAKLLQVLDRRPVGSDRDLELLATVLLHGELEQFVFHFLFLINITLTKIFRYINRHHQLPKLLFIPSGPLTPVCPRYFR